MTFLIKKAFKLFTKLCKAQYNDFRPADGGTPSHTYVPVYHDGILFHRCQWPSKIPTCQCFLVRTTGTTPLFLHNSHLPMAAPPLVFEFIGIIFTAVLYGKYCTIQHPISDDGEHSLRIIGFYCVIFSLYWRIQLKRAAAADRRRKGVFSYALIAIFILCTAYLFDCTVKVMLNITVSHDIQVVYYYLDVTGMAI